MTHERSWLPGYLYTGGAFESGLAMIADAEGRIARFSREPADLAAARPLPGRALLPGLVNVHSHAFQRTIRGRTEQRTALSGRDTFWTWREGMYHAANMLSPEAVYHSARMAFLEMALAGITTVGEFHYVHHAPGGAPFADRNLLALQILQAAREVGLRIALLRVAYVRAGWNQPAHPGQACFITPRPADFVADTEALRSGLKTSAVAAGARAWVGVAPHSVRAVPLDYLLEVAAYARSNDLPLHMHVAEQPAEVEACIEEYDRAPVELLYEHGVLSHRFTAVHAIHITTRDMAHLANTQSTVCACPTTERNLGDGAVPADDLFRAGVAIAFGSDSNVQIDPMEDARALEYNLRMKKLERAVLAPDASPGSLARRLFACATSSGAASLQSPGGSLDIGRAADFFTVDLNDSSLAGAGPESLLNHIVFGLEKRAIRDVCVAGEFVVRDGAHPLEEEITRNFGDVQRSLWGASQ